MDVDGLGAGRAGDVERDLCLLFTLFDQGRRAGLRELLCGDSFTVAKSAAEAVKLPPPGVQQFDHRPTLLLGAARKIPALVEWRTQVSPPR